MEIWIKKTESDAFQIPINPPGFDISKEAGNSTVEIHGLGEISMLGKGKLKEISFSSIFPKQKYDFCEPVKNLLKPYEYIKKLEAWMDDGPVRLIISGTNVNTMASIESLSCQEDDGSGDVSYTISFKKYRKPSYSKPKKTSKNTMTIYVSAVKRNGKTVMTAKYKVKKGDTLRKIAKKKTGSASNWRALYNQNKSKIEKAAKKHGKKSSRQGKFLYPGTVLVMRV